MGIAADLAAFSAALDSAIDAAMQGPVLDGAKKAIWMSALERVYGAYTPKFYSRRMSGGGLGSEDTKEAHYGDKTLLIRDTTTWQHLWGGEYPGEMLAEAIANGDPSYNFGKAGPRSFMPEAEEDFAPEFERILGGAIAAAGFKVL